ncbi:hypothetical protein WG219_11920 [Ectopseudomonas mendocina]|uniref:Uncharacterized protein n=1 Tax=Ectopseudomonas mendocina TaxID=300 RepID=A0ABZ2RAL4_ECTME
MTAVIFEWFMINPARLMVAISLAFSLFIIKAEYDGRKTGGSGWLTLARQAIGIVFTFLTAIVAAFYGGIGAFFGYLALQFLVCVVLPAFALEVM